MAAADGAVPVDMARILKLGAGGRTDDWFASYMNLSALINELRPPPWRPPCGGLATFRRQGRWRRRVLHVIPLHDGWPLAANRTWCDELLRLERDEGYELAMHGVYHHGHGSGQREFEALTEVCGRSCGGGRECPDDRVAGNGP